jgi:hypothetical protein
MTTTTTDLITTRGLGKAYKGVTALPALWYVPLIASGVWSSVFVVGASWRFGREEF